MVATRQLLKHGAKIPLARHFSAWLADRRFERWKTSNPGQDFADFYVHDVCAKLRDGAGHPTLGARGFKSGSLSSIDWDRANFATRGAGQWTYYAKVTGLAPGKRCVDFGCGSLRIGQHAIRALDTGHYWGLDICDSFYTAGLALLDPDLIVERAPHLSVVSDEAIRSVRSWKPDAIFANAVLQHVPTSELGIFFERIAALLVPGGVAAITFIGAPVITRVKAMSWAYPDQLLIDTIARIDDSLVVTCEPIEGSDSKAFNGRRRLLTITRPSPG